VSYNNHISVSYAEYQRTPAEDSDEEEDLVFDAIIDHVTPDTVTTAGGSHQ
jgi:hypothetical protein